MVFCANRRQPKNNCAFSIDSGLDGGYTEGVKLNNRLAMGAGGMQVPKDNVKSSILAAATEEFLVNGYRHSSMRAIAEQAGITVGNIYSYFSGKEHLLESILSPTVAELEALVAIPVDGEIDSPATLEGLARAVVEIYLRNREQFLVLVNATEGSKFENARQALVQQAQRRMEAEFAARGKRVDPLLTEALALGIIEGLINMLTKYGGDEARLRQTVNVYLRITFSDIHKRL